MGEDSDLPSVNELVVPLRLQDDGGAVGWALAQQNAPYTEALGTLLGLVLGFVIVYTVGRTVVSSALSRILGRRGVDKRAERPLMKIATLVMAFVTLGAGFAFAGLDNIPQSLVTIGAAATLAIGFTMQGIIVSFVAGIFIFTDKPSRINNWIEWDDSAGVVEGISFRMTRVRTFDNELLAVPNSQLTDGIIKSPVAKDRLRLQVPFGIGYNNNIQRVTNIILDEAENHEGIMATFRPSVRPTGLNGSSVMLESRIWISQSSRIDFVKTHGECATAVKGWFDEEGTDIPYPSHTLNGEFSVDGAERPAQSND